MKVSTLLNLKTDLVSKHFELLKGSLFTDITEFPNYNLVTGFLTYSIWNYVIPKITHVNIDFDEIEGALVCSTNQAIATKLPTDKRNS